MKLLSPLIPRFMFRFFLEYGNIFDRFLNNPKNRERISDSEQNEVFFLKLLAQYSAVPDMKMKMHFHAHHLDPKNPENLDQLIKASQKAVESAYAHRNFVEFEFYLSKIEPLDPIFVKFYRLYANQYLKAGVSLQEWKDLLREAQQKKSIVQRNIHSQLITKYIHLENLESAIEEFKKVNKNFYFGKQDIRISIGILKLALKKGKLDVANDFRAYISNKVLDKDLRRFSKLKLFEIYTEIDEQNNLHRDPSDLSKEMFGLLKELKTTKENTAYILHLEKIYQNLGEKHSLLLDIRISKDEQKKLTDLVNSKVENKEPFLLLRLGDADSYGLESISFDREVFEKDCRSREMKWWGEHLPQDVRDKIRGLFRETLRSCDVMGIPSIFRFISDLSDLHTSFLAERNQRGSVVVMDSMNDLVMRGHVPSNMIFTENRCHHALFNHTAAKILAKKADHVIVVSHYEHAVMQGAFDMTIDTVQVPGEGARHGALPFCIDQLVEELKTKTKKGSLVFVASGFAGKYFLKVAKDMGAIGLDVGAMADYWVGVKSRGISELV